GEPGGRAGGFVRMVWQFGVQAGVDGMRGEVVEQQGIGSWLGPRDNIRCDGGTRARAVFHNNGLAQHSAGLIGYGARHHVGDAAGGKADDHAYGLGGEASLRLSGAGREGQGAKKGADDFLYLSHDDSSCWFEPLSVIRQAGSMPARNLLFVPVLRLG